MVIAPRILIRPMVPVFRVLVSLLDSPTSNTSLSSQKFSNRLLIKCMIAGEHQPFTGETSCVGKKSCSFFLTGDDCGETDFGKVALYILAPIAGALVVCCVGSCAAIYSYRRRKRFQYMPVHTVSLNDNVTYKKY